LVKSASRFRATVEKITDAMYGVVNEDGARRERQVAGIEVSGKSGTRNNWLRNPRAMGKQKKFEDNAWFVATRRSQPEIAVAVLVQESGKHGGEAAGRSQRRHQSLLRQEEQEDTGSVHRGNQDDATGKARLRRRRLLHERP